MTWIVKNYRATNDKEPINEWLDSVRDITTLQRIEKQILKLRHGNFGDHKRFSGIIELRLHFGKGYRIYCGQDGHSLIILLIGGDKGAQSKDIKLALNPDCTIGFGIRRKIQAFLRHKKVLKYATVFSNFFV